MTTVEFYNKNQDRVEEAFSEHISYKDDKRLVNSEVYFWEFVETMMDNEISGNK